mmetsp:Transcript_17093/g.19655  ORF Transcript_17093/g.19655 Transcript_17093/m.19655 type:complete len:447 (-) Transcript_17093:610-1950(-)
MTSNNDEKENNEKEKTNNVISKTNNVTLKSTNSDDPNKNDGSTKLKAQSYSCTGVTIYTDKMAMDNEAPTCIGITGQKKDITLNLPPMTPPRTITQQPIPPQRTTVDPFTGIPGGINFGVAGGPRPVQPKLQEFRNVCVGYAHVIALSQKNASEHVLDHAIQMGVTNDGQQPQSVPIVIPPNCQFGVSLIHDRGQTPPVAPNQQQHPLDLAAANDAQLRRMIEMTQKMKQQAERDAKQKAKTQKEQPNDSNDDHHAPTPNSDELKVMAKAIRTAHKASQKEHERQLDRDVAKLQRRAQQSIEKNESDPETWKKREKVEEERKRRRLEREKRQSEKNRKSGAKDEEEHSSLPIKIPTMDEYLAYTQKLAGLSANKLQSNAVYIKDELWNAEFPRRVYHSSERLINHFSWSASLFEKAGTRCINSVGKFCGFPMEGDGFWKGGGNNGN